MKRFSIDERWRYTDAMQLLTRALWVLSIIGAVVGIFVLIQAWRKAPTEREISDCAMIATACALVPYLLARSVVEVMRPFGTSQLSR